MADRSISASFLSLDLLAGIGGQSVRMMGDMIHRRASIVMSSKDALTCLVFMYVVYSGLELD